MTRDRELASGAGLLLVVLAAAVMFAVIVGVTLRRQRRVIEEQRLQIEELRLQRELWCCWSAYRAHGRGGL